MSQMKFEEAMGKLGDIVSSLEGEDLDLEESLKKYEEGVRLSQFCIKKLEEARRKIQMLSKLESGKIEAKPFGQEESEEASEEVEFLKESQAPSKRNKAGKKTPDAKERDALF